MFEKIRKMKNKKGFTLVELIVVLVILVILAALLIPALTGYIDKANKEKVVSECRMVVMAAQTTVSEKYGQGTNKVTFSDSNAATPSEISSIADLAEVSAASITAVNYDAQGKITSVTYTNKGYTCNYANNSYSVG